MEIEVTQQEHGERVEKILQRRLPGVTRSQWRYLVETKKVQRNGRSVSWGERLKGGSTLTLLEIPLERDLWRPSPSATPPLALRWEGKHTLVFEKPPGLPTMPKNPDDVPTAAGYMAHAHPQLVEAAEPRREGGIVNRLDNGTAGLLVVGKRPEVYHKLRKQYANHLVEKEYWAVVTRQNVERQWVEGRVISQVGAKDRVGYEAGFEGPGRRAVSLVEPLVRGRGVSLVRVVTRFGRRHQVRVQLAYLGAPIYNDLQYGTPVEQFQGHFLWARRVTYPQYQPRGQRGKLPPLTVEAASLPAQWLLLAQCLGLGEAFEGVVPLPEWGPPLP